MISLLNKKRNYTVIDDIIEQLDNFNNSSVVVPAHWAQGRTVYGGLTAAMIYQRMQQVVKQQHADELRPIRFLNLSFIAPLMVEEALSIEVEMLRSGRSATQLIAHVKQQGKTCVIAQACFGIKRQSKIQLTDQHPLDMPLPAKANFIPQVPKVVPKFLRHFDINLQDGRFPFMHSKKSHLKGWMRFKHTPQAFNDAHLIALIDAWPSTVLQQLKLPAAASTMNWNLEFTQSAALPHPDEWLAYQAHTAHAADGYVFGDAHVWNAQGQLLVLSRQTVGVFG